MRPEGLKTKIFLDSGDPSETKQLLAILGFLDGQTTNPTLVSKNPYARKRFENGEKFSEAEMYGFYQKVVSDISALIPNGSVSIEVYADQKTTAEAMLTQGKEMNSWIPNAHIKYPTTSEGLEAAERSIKHGLCVNMTLCFSQSQSAAVYAATKGAQSGDVFVSPFIGRLDDQGDDGMSLIKNIVTMYKSGDGHVQVLAASVRTIAQFMQCLNLEVDIITAPFSVLEQWGKAGKQLPEPDFRYESVGLKPIPYQDIDVNQLWTSYDIHHELTDSGVAHFAEDWNNLIV
jgi:transaldolase